MTEEQAKTKWCPMVRTHPGATTVVGPDGLTTIQRAPGGNCIGSGCAMWRSVLADPATHPGSHGYCGLAGNPYPKYVIPA